MGRASYIRLVDQPDGKEEAPCPMTDLSDDDLMVLVKGDHELAFRVLVERHHPLVLGMATRFFGDRTQGRDVAQDVFLAVWADRDRYYGQGSFRGFLATITLHRCHHLARQKQSEGRRVFRLASMAPAPGDGIAGGAGGAGGGEGGGAGEGLPLDLLVERERAREVRKRLAQIPETTRSVLILRYGHDFSLEEIASATKMPMGTVKSHIFRGLKALQRLMKKQMS